MILVPYFCFLMSGDKVDLVKFIVLEFTYPWLIFFFMKTLQVDSWTFNNFQLLGRLYTRYHGVKITLWNKK